eukprot:UC1_evm2s2202
MRRFRQPTRPRAAKATVSTTTVAEARKTAVSSSSSSSSDAGSSIEATLRAQAKVIWTIQDTLSNVSHALRPLLKANELSTRGGNGDLLRRASEAMLFGPLRPCKVCGQNIWKLKAWGYLCGGNIDEWTPCTCASISPPRSVVFKVPEYYKDDEHILSAMAVAKAAADAEGVKKAKRVFSEEKPKAARAAAPVAGVKREASDQASESTASSAAAAAAVTVGSAATADAVSLPPPDKPLAGLIFALCGRFDGGMTALKKRLTKLGAEIQTSGTVGSQVTALIATESAATKSPKKVGDALHFGVPVVSESYIAACEVGSCCALLRPHLLKHSSSTVIEPSLRNQGLDALRRKRVKSSGPRRSGHSSGGGGNSTTTRVVVKGRAAVDPDSYLEETHHVLETSNTIWNCSLSNVDARAQTNSYYKMQVLVPDRAGASGAVLFRSWGRVGTGRGGTKKATYSGLAAAQEEFLRLFAEKTGNQDFNDQASWTKVPGYFYPLRLQYEDADTVAAAGGGVVPGSLTKLPKPVVELIDMIFDKDRLTSVMREMELDTAKMPLGQLSREHLVEALSVLSDLQRMFSDSTASATAAKKRRGKAGGAGGRRGAKHKSKSKTAKVTRAELLGASNRFYSMIPHDFGARQPPIIDNEELLLQKLELVESLLEIEVAARLIKTAREGDAAATIDPIDINYRQLKTELVPLDKRGAEFEMVRQYVANTHGETHTQFALDVEEVFTVVREGEKEAFSAFADKPNRQLLFHGSRMTNFAGILSEGLRIAPPNAPVTGYMFGKGVYFANSASKSAQYCYASGSNSTGLMLLSEVALGATHQLTDAEYDLPKKLAKGTLSTHGVGGMSPDPSGSITTDDGTIVPMGKIQPVPGVNSSLLYDEFIVYNTDQIRNKYLVRLKFSYPTSRW